MSMLPQDIFISLQQVRSDSVICAPGVAHTIAGTAAQMSRIRNAPNSRKAFIRPLDDTAA